MLILRNFAAIAQLVDPAIRHLIELRVAQINEVQPWDADEIGPFVLVEPGDGDELLESQVGISLLKGLFEDARFPDENFAPAFESLEAHPTCFEAVFILSDSGFGIDLFIPKQLGIDADLLALCSAYATTAT